MMEEDDSITHCDGKLNRIQASETTDGQDEHHTCDGKINEKYIEEIVSGKWEWNSDKKCIKWKHTCF